MPADPSSPVEELIPEHPTLECLRESAANCRGCSLWRNATQTVFGEGHSHADVVMVGEQPGDVEDRTGRPFAGPGGKLRLHKKPSSEEIRACRPWLDAELEVLEPRVLVCLGATAAQALLGGTFRVTRQRGQFVESELAPLVLATVHPSSVLRAPDDEARAVAYRGLVDDLSKVARALSG